MQATDDNDPSDPSDDAVITYAHDSLSRVIKETQRIGALTAKAISSAWRANNLRSQLTYPNDRVLATTYDNLDRIDTITDQGAAQSIADYDYIGTYRMLQRLYPINGSRMTYLDNPGTNDTGYDGLRRPVELRHLRSNDSIIVGFTHNYDRMNNKLTEGKLHDPTNNEVYTYDSAYRLISFQRPNPGAMAPTQSNWTLDGTGNWVQVDGETREHSSFNEITVRDDGTATTLGYDDNGNQTDSGSLALRWDYMRNDKA